MNYNDDNSYIKFFICNFFEVQTKYTVLSFENVALKSYLVFDDLSGKSNTYFHCFE